MKIIRHRVNRIAEIRNLDLCWGAEIDLRSDVAVPGSIHLSHDAWTRGDPFGEWLREYAARKISGPLILDTKEDGLETRALELLRQNRIENFFFLDTAPPTLVKHAKRNGQEDFAIRVSAFEPVEAALLFAGDAKWVWVDCFDGVPLDETTVRSLVGRFKLCLVSPELQGCDRSMIGRFRSIAALCDAVCTKVPEDWESRK